jgi:hypothetical protein
MENEEIKQSIRLRIIHDCYFNYYIIKKRSGEVSEISDSVMITIYETYKYFEKYEKCEELKKFYMVLCCEMTANSKSKKIRSFHENYYKSHLYHYLDYLLDEGQDYVDYDMVYIGNDVRIYFNLNNKISYYDCVRSRIV